MATAVALNEAVANADELAVSGTITIDIKDVSKAIDLYNKIQVIPWETVDKFIEQLKETEQQYSEESSRIIGEVQTLLMDSMDQYKSSIKAVDFWCTTAAVLLQEFILLFPEITITGVATAQLSLFTAVLNEGQIVTTKAMKALELSSMTFNAAWGKLTTLNAVFSKDFSNGSAFKTAAVKKVRVEAYAGAVAGVVFGPVGLIVSYSIATGVAEGSLIPALEKEFKETETAFLRMSKLVKDAQVDFTSVKASVEDDIVAIGKISSQIATSQNIANTWATAPEHLIAPLIRHATHLMKMCSDYTKNMDSKSRVVTWEDGDN